LRKQAFKGRFLIRIQNQAIKEVSVMKDSDISDITNIKINSQNDLNKDTHAVTIIICQREAIKNGGI
jgi:hypothetical protein